MRRLSLFLLLFALLAVASGAHPAASTATQMSAAQETRFRVRIENIANGAGQTAANGTRWPFALSPGLWATHSGNNPLFIPNRRANGTGLEAQAEDGNPEPLSRSLAGMRSVVTSGIFNTPAGADQPGAITPGHAYEFTVSARPGARLSLAFMFGQSNDLFYAPGAGGIRLFDARGRAISGDITTQFALWDAGTEVNQEPGVGPDQAPRQSAPNTGAAESAPVRHVRDSFSYPETRAVLRVTITPEM